MKSRVAVLALGLVFISMAFLHRRVPVEPKREPAGSAIDLGPAPFDPPVAEMKSTPETPQAILVPESESTKEERPRQARSFATDLFIRLAKTQNSDGSWGDGIARLGDLWIDETGVTALTLVSFMQFGYSHLSKDEYDGLSFGVAVKHGLLALLRRQAEDGSFPSAGDRSVNHILATWALSEAYGMSATQLFKGPAQRSVDAMSRTFSSASGWGSDSKAAWASLALYSAKWSELEVGTDLVDRSIAFGEESLSPGSRPLAAAAWATLKGRRHNRLDLGPATERLSIDPLRVDRVTGFFESIVMRHYEGKDGERWKARSRQVATMEMESLTAETWWTGRREGDSIVQSSLVLLQMSLWWWHDPWQVMAMSSSADPEEAPVSNP